MGISINRRRVMKNVALCYDSRIEYLESTGTQWIDTGFKATNGAILEYEIMPMSYYDNVIVGSHNPSNDSSNGYNRFAMQFNSEIYVRFNKCNSYNDIGYSCPLNNKYKIYYNTILYNRIGKINDNYIINIQDIYILNPVNNVVIGFNQYANTPTVPFKIYNLKVTNSEYNVVRNFIPVRVGQVGYLYDTVSGQLFGNQGTGSFVLGPDI